MVPARRKAAPMRWLSLLLVSQWSVGFEEYEEMPSRWQAGKDGSQCAYAKPGMLPQAIRSRLASSPSSAWTSRRCSSTG